MSFEANKPIPKLSDIRKMERKEKEFKFDNSCMVILKKAIEYYRINYPNSHMKITWDKPKIILGIGNGTIEEELDKLTEIQLRSIYEIFDYFHEERQMPKIDEHRFKNRIIAMINHIIPGGHFMTQLKGLYKKRRNVQRKIDNLEDRLLEERGKFETLLENKKDPSKPVCKVCGKVCGNRGGLAIHMKTHARK